MVTLEEAQELTLLVEGLLKGRRAKDAPIVRTRRLLHKVVFYASAEAVLKCVKCGRRCSWVEAKLVEANPKCPKCDGMLHEMEQRYEA